MGTVTAGCTARAHASTMPRGDTTSDFTVILPARIFWRSSKSLVSAAIMRTPSAIATSSVCSSAGESSPDKHASTPAARPCSGFRISWPAVHTPWRTSNTNTNTRWLTLVS
jgi:hypothetical protein